MTLSFYWHPWRNVGLIKKGALEGKRNTPGMGMIRSKRSRIAVPEIFKYTCIKLKKCLTLS